MTFKLHSISCSDQAQGLVVLFLSGSTIKRRVGPSHRDSQSVGTLAPTGIRRMLQSCYETYQGTLLQATNRRPISSWRFQPILGNHPSRCHEETFQKIHGRMRNFHVLTRLGTTLPCPVDELSVYPHVEKSEGYMGKPWRSLNHFSPVRPPPK